MEERFPVHTDSLWICVARYTSTRCLFDSFPMLGALQAGRLNHGQSVLRLQVTGCRPPLSRGDWIYVVLPLFVHHTHHVSIPSSDHHPHSAVQSSNTPSQHLTSSPDLNASRVVATDETFDTVMISILESGNMANEHHASLPRNGWRMGPLCKFPTGLNADHLSCSLTTRTRIRTRGQSLEPCQNIRKQAAR